MSGTTPAKSGDTYKLFFPPSGGHNCTVTFTYRPDGRLDHLADFYSAQNPRTVQLAYSPEGDLVQTTDPMGFTRKYTYSREQPLAWQNHNLLTCLAGKDRTYLVVGYDPETDRVVSEQYGTAAQVFHFSYPPVAPANSVLMTDRRGVVTSRLDHDAAGHVVQQFVSDATTGAYWNQTFNEAGEVTLLQKPGANAESWTYDEANPDPLHKGDIVEHRRIASTATPDLVESWTYCQNVPWSRKKTRTNPQGGVTSFYYDFEEAGLGDQNGDGVTNLAGGHVVRIAYPTVTLGQPAPQVIEEKFWRGADGRLVRAIDPNGKATVFEYFASGPEAGYCSRTIDDFGRLNLTTSRTVDAVGNTLTETTPRQFVFTYTVNRLDQVTAVDGPLGYRTENVYDENRRRTQQRIKNLGPDGLQNPDLPWIVTDWAYTLLGDLETETRTVTATVSATTTHGYDLDQHQTSIAYPGGRVDTMELDFWSHVTQSVVGAGSASPVTTGYEYTAGGLLRKTLFAGGDAMYRAYDGHDRLSFTSCDEHVTASTYAFLDGVEDDCEQCKDDSPTKNSGDLGAAGGDPSGTGPGSGSTAMNVDASPCGAGLPPCTDGTPRMRVGERLECGSGQRKSQHQVSRRRASGTGAAQPP